VGLPPAPAAAAAAAAAPVTAPNQHVRGVNLRKLPANELHKHGTYPSDIFSYFV
jgi:hypothetical protein